MVYQPGARGAGMGMGMEGYNECMRRTLCLMGWEFSSFEFCSCSCMHACEQLSSLVQSKITKSKLQCSVEGEVEVEVLRC